jgi:hypothetical protein
MRYVLIPCLLLTLSACSTGPFPVSSPYFQIPAGSTIVLKQELTIPPNAGRVYIQYGKVVTPKEKDSYHAHCWFLSWDVLDTAQVIKPDTFVVTKSQQLEDVVMRGTDTQLAMNGAGFGMYEGGGPMALEYSTEMHIHSDKQPVIRRFVCSHWENPTDARHLTVAQMQATLGQIAEIHLNVSESPMQ